jgi:hypothetical protein
MTTRLGFGMILLSASFVTASAVGIRSLRPSRPEPPAPSIAAPEESPIESLDRNIQVRIHEHVGNGMARIIHPMGQLHQYRPESPAEEEVVAGLRRSGWTVGLRLGARSLLAPDAKPGEGWWDVTPPIAITEGELSGDLPGHGELREFGRKALASSDHEGSGNVSGSIGRWSVEARVIRADRQSCLDCHARRAEAVPPAGASDDQRPLKVGDAVGVALYFYAPKRP